MTETLISVDIETSGPIPGTYSMLAVGACAVDTPDDGFYIELQPTSGNAVPEALAVAGFDLEQLQSDGAEPADGMRQFATWLSRYEKPVFVGFNAPFDWSFVNYYFLTFADGNPFGISGIDIKAFAMGRLRCSWDETRSSRLAKRFGTEQQTAHQALADARQQAALFRAIRAVE